MKMPDAFKANALPRFEEFAGEPNHKKFMALDAKVRLHNMARRVAMVANQEGRKNVLNDLGEKHGPQLMARIKRLTIWYWRTQRRLKNARTINKK